ncbi:MAG TPA: serine/threonine-protein kinase [Polyangiaceae bacterium]|nr:serine/threonine-protein kinase [Polyangiaceae bacterium]
MTPHGSGSAQDASSRRIGQVLRERWRIERLLGEGGMAAVYAVRHLTNGGAFAVKMLHQEMSEREDIRERFRREGYAANKVGHPGVVKVIDDDVADDGSAFLLMELLEGESFTARANRGPLDDAELLRVIDEVLDILAAAHEQKIVHRDLKPDNIFLTNDGRVKLLDFGIARVLDNVPTSFKTRTGTAIGTAPYMAPEQALGRVNDVDARSDLFSIGATMFRLIARRRIHEVKNDADLLVAMATMPAPPLSSVAPHASSPMCAIVDRALAFLPARRYSNARAMQSDVQALRRGEKPPFASDLAAKGIEPWVTREPAAAGDRSDKTVNDVTGGERPQGPEPFMTPPPAATATPPVMGRSPPSLGGPPSFGAPASQTAVSGRTQSRSSKLVLIVLLLGGGAVVLGLLVTMALWLLGVWGEVTTSPSSRAPVPRLPAPAASTAPLPGALPTANAPPAPARAPKSSKERAK